jgi:hypothetical protein
VWYFGTKSTTFVTIVFSWYWYFLCVFWCNVLRWI